jgi:hypothetical protein
MHIGNIYLYWKDLTIEVMVPIAIHGRIYASVRILDVELK